MSCPHVGKVFGVLVTKEEWSAAQVHESHQLMRSRALPPLWLVEKFKKLFGVMPRCSWTIPGRK